MVVPALTRDLAAPVRSFRIYALEQAIREGSGEDLCQELLARQSVEQDAECRLLLTHALAAVRERTAVGGAVAVSPVGSADPLSAFAQGNAARRLEVLRGVSGHDTQLLAHYAPDWLRAETDPVVATAIVRKFSVQWPAEHVDVLLDRLRSAYLIERLAVLEALVTRAPERLTAELPALLADDDPRLRALAIQGLARVDLDEATEHLESMLGDADPNVRRCGIQNGNFLPFVLVKPLLLQYLAAENERSLIDLAGLVLQINPDVEIPYALNDLLAHATAQKATWLQPIFDGACRAIEVSGLLGDGYAAYLERLRQAVRRRQAQRRAQAVIAQALVADDAEELALLANDLAAQPELREAVAETLRGDLPASVREPVRKLVELADNARASTAAMAAPGKSTGPSAYDPTRLAVRDRVRLLALWEGAEGRAAAPVVRSLLDDRSLDADLRAASLRHALRLDLGEFVDAAVALLGHADHRVAAAALVYVAQFDVDKVIPLLGQFLMLPSMRVKSAAVAVLRRVDLAQATRALASMLTPRQSTAQQVAALGCLAQFDFAVVRGVLLEYLLRGPTDDLFVLGLALFIANPERENLTVLYGLEQTVGDGRRPSVAAARQQNITALTDLGIIGAADAAGLEATLADNFQRRQARARAEPPPYALRKVRPGTGDTESSTEGAAISTRLRRLLLALIVCTVISLSWWAADRGNEPGAGDPRPGPVLALPTIVVGTVESVGGAAGSVVVRANGGAQFVFLPTGAVLRGLARGDRIKATVIPFRVDEGGRVMAQARVVERQASSEKSIGPGTTGSGVASAPIQASGSVK